MPLEEGPRWAPIEGDIYKVRRISKVWSISARVSMLARMPLTAQIRYSILGVIPIEKVPLSA